MDPKMPPKWFQHGSKIGSKTCPRMDPKMNPKRDVKSEGLCNEMPIFSNLAWHVNGKRVHLYALPCSRSVGGVPAGAKRTRAHAIHAT